MVLDRYASSFALLNELGLMVSEEGKPASTHPALPWAAAFSTEHPTDAHFTCYYVRNRSSGIPEPRAPRIAKSAIALLHSDLVPAALRDIEVYGHTLALDFDLPSHGRWNPQFQASAEEIFREYEKRQSILATPSVFYATSGGFRLVWALAEAVPVEGARGLEDLLAGMVAEAHISGLAVDPMCRDWTRLFRLPKVRRDDKPVTECQSWNQPYFRQSWGSVRFDQGTQQGPDSIRVFPLAAFRGLSERNPDEFQTPMAKRLYEKWKYKVGRAPMQSSVMAQEIVVGQMPDDVEAQRLLYVEGSTKETVLTTRVRRTLEAYANPRGKEARPLPSAVHAISVIWERASLFPGVESGEQGLHEGIGKLARSVCYCMRSELGEGPGQLPPQFIYALLLKPIREANERRPSGRRGDGELCNETWRLVSHVYRQFVFQLKEADRQKEEDASDQLLASDNQLALEYARQEALITQLRGWIRRDPVKGDALPAAYEEWLANNWERLLLVDAPGTGMSVLSLNPTGSVVYSTPVGKLGNVFAAVRDSGHNLVAIKKMGQGEETYKSEQQILHEYSTIAIDSRYSRLIDAHRVELVPHRDGLAPVFLHHLPGLRTDITPKYDKLVDQWLHCLAGPLVDKLLDWLACFTQLEQPCCGLYIQGSPSIGKGMLALGLTNMCSTRTHAKLESALDQFQDTMLKTPFVWGDEDSSLPTRVSRSMMNTYKKLISGEFNTLNAKGVAAQAVDGHWRVYISANTSNYLRMDEDVTGEDLEAIVLRCLHIQADSEAVRQFFESIGGRGSKPGEGTFGWPEHNIPCHVAWLVANRKVLAGRRFMVEGVHSDYHERLSVTTGVTDGVLRGLGQLLKEPKKYQDSILIRDGEVYVFTAGLLGQLRQMHAQDKASPRFNAKSVGQALFHLSVDKKRTSIWVQMIGQSQPAPHNAWKLDIRYVLRLLHHAGEDTDFRDSLGEQRWRAIAPPEAVQVVDDPPPELRRRALPPPAPRPAYANGTNGHQNGANGHANGHHPPPMLPPTMPMSHALSSEPFLGTSNVKPPVLPPPRPGMN